MSAAYDAKGGPFVSSLVCARSAKSGVSRKEVSA